MGIGTSADGSSSLSLLAAVRKLVAAGCVVAFWAFPPPGAGTPMIFDDSMSCVFGRRLRDYFVRSFFCFFLVEEEKISERGEREFFFCVFFWL